MQAQTLAAAAACAAAALSLINVGYQAYLSNKNEARKWQRDKLPDIIRMFSGSNHKLNAMTFFQAEEWKASKGKKEAALMAEYRKSMELLDALEVTASSKVAIAARKVSYSISNGIDYLRFHFDTPEYNLDWERELYWEYAEASYAFLCLSRKELGLGTLPPPPGLLRWRERSSRARSLPRPASKSTEAKASPPVETSP
ncbi:hypothetical protein [Micromonospora fulviviridis]|uniref:DUF4760 domain-containing protein n=1 Tax=Micromonospora fulviviridis TaxID=47860 RepID=A0ABV2VBZ8_9ACTN